MIKKLPIGISDFKEIIEEDYFYVDKTLFIKEILDKGDKIMLIPRPRRFGKTLNLSMLKYFYDCLPTSLSPDSPSSTATDHPTTHSYKHLFSSLAIMKAGEEYTNKLGQFPVIFLSFRSIKEKNWDSCLREIKKLIQGEYIKHDYLLAGSKLKKQEQDFFKRIIDLKGDAGDYANSLEKLMIFLKRFYGKRVVVLIDEYDAPVHAGYTQNYYEEIINFMRNFLCSALKDTDQYLEKSILTGIMRVAKESIFSGLNNLGVYTLTAGEFDDKFGFTETEVETILKQYELTNRYDDIRRWYNGYYFGEKIIYNPWSLINFLGSKKKTLKPYWLNTSDNKLVETLLTKGGKELKEEMEQLIRGEVLEKAIDENIVLKDLNTRENLLWSFLLMAGYLKQTDRRLDEVSSRTYYRLSIPNLELREAYVKIVENYFSTKIENRKLEEMLDALVKGDIDVFEEIFSDYVLKSMSFFDTDQDSEKVYHAFVMGLLLWLPPGYRVKSNRESGYGRYDIMIFPADAAQLGFIIEFKKVRKKETLETAMESALKQIEERKYETELLQTGIKNYIKLAIVFQGKNVTIKEG